MRKQIVDLINTTILVSPPILVVVAWFSLYRASKATTSKARERISFVSLIIVTISTVNLLLGYYDNSRFIGPDYSDRGEAIVAVNLGLDLAAGLAAALNRHPSRAILTASAILTALAWFLVGAYRSVV